MRALGRDLGAFPPPGVSPVAHLDALGVLSPQALLVHLTLTRGEDLDRVARTGARAVLCPRSNLHITGRLPDAEGILARGIPLALGTDSLASCPDLDVLAEAACARERFPEVPPARWLEAITAGGAEVLGVAGMGIVEEGTAAPLLHVEIPETETPVERLLDGTRWRRSWV
jgi:cytosine/adenosine deaminase-related metal-dependent hydrolase